MATDSVVASIHLARREPLLPFLLLTAFASGEDETRTLAPSIDAPEAQAQVPVTERSPYARRAVPCAGPRSLFEQVLRVADEEFHDEFRYPFHIDDIAEADLVREADRLVVSKDSVQYALSFDATPQGKFSTWLEKKNPLRGVFTAGHLMRCGLDICVRDPKQASHQGSIGG